ncbi:zincin-like metallopeptidase domain-containing protein [Variovorax sp. OK605]|uniref:zincin-like metallopeptidase domain-containing protein n=1 Tax=Variovorax sp. OK605 TaxID=1855317 RepID=UPI00210DEACC|nr:zincin-like metallopeptidase domain-containing protein [Variovorax sp. OK605]
MHWAGHPDRSNRRFGQRFGDAAYAFEELVAELGSAFVMGHCGLVDATVEGHAAYIDAWLQVLGATARRSSRRRVLRRRPSRSSQRGRCLHLGSPQRALRMHEGRRRSRDLPARIRA